MRIGCCAGCGWRSFASYSGRVSERLKELVLKTSVPERVPWVRIPPLPIIHRKKKLSVISCQLSVKAEKKEWIPQHLFAKV